jgi:polysaccharide biosynthesis protein PslH
VSLAPAAAGSDPEGRTTVVVPRPKSSWSISTIFKAVVTTPRHFAAPLDRGVVAELRRLHQQHQFQAVIAYELTAALYARDANLSGAAKIMDGIEPFNLARQDGTLRGRLRTWKLKGFLARALAEFDALIAVSEVEADWLAEHIPTLRPKLTVIPNGADEYAGEYTQRASRLIFTGSLNYDANLDAVRQFLTSVWPSLRADYPDLTFQISGDLPSARVIAEIERLGGALCGTVSDYPRWVSASTALVALLRVGGGTRIKIIEALAWGCPVVATSKAVEGLSVVPGRDALVADDRDSQVAAVRLVLTDQAMRRRLVQNGRQLAARYTWDRSRRMLVDLVERCCAT